MSYLQFLSFNTSLSIHTYVLRSETWCLQRYSTITRVRNAVRRTISRCVTHFLLTIVPRICIAFNAFVSSSRIYRSHTQLSYYIRACMCLREYSTILLKVTYAMMYKIAAHVRKSIGANWFYAKKSTILPAITISPYREYLTLHNTRILFVM